MASKEGAQIDSMPIQLYGWNYATSQPVKVAVDSDGKLEVTDGE